MADDDQTYGYQRGANRIYSENQRKRRKHENQMRFNTEANQMKSFSNSISDEYKIQEGIIRLRNLKSKIVISSEQKELEKKTQRLEAALENQLQNFHPDHPLTIKYKAICNQ